MRNRTRLFPFFFWTVVFICVFAPRLCVADSQLSDVVAEGVNLPLLRAPSKIRMQT